MRKPTNWDRYSSSPKSFIAKYFFLNLVVKSYERLLKNIKFDKPIKILEFGCGTSYINLFLSRRFKVKKIIGIDSNKKMLNISKQTLSKLSCDKKFINENFFKIKLAEQYDIVHSQGVIEHFERVERLELLKKHFDATKKGGFCIIYAPIPTGYYIFFRKLAEILNTWKYTDEVPLDKTTIIEEMEAIGFTTLNIDYFWKFFLTEVGILFKKT